MARSILSRRAFLALGLGLGGSLSAPTGALAVEVTLSGHMPDGTPITGLVTYDGVIYGYVGGVKVVGREEEIEGGARWFAEGDGAMARSEWVEAEDGEWRHYGEDGVRDAVSAVAPGAYAILMAGTSLALAVDSGKVSKGANVQVWESNSSMAQRFYVEFADDGSLVVASVASGLVLDVDSGTMANGTNVRLWERNGTKAQAWVPRANEDGTVTLLCAKDESFALDVASGSEKSGANVQIYADNGTSAQKFKLRALDSMLAEGVYTLRPYVDRDKVLDVKDGSHAEGAALQVYASNGTLAQRFEVHNLDGGIVRVRTAASGGWLAAEGEEAGCAVIQSGGSATKASDADTWEPTWVDGTGMALASLASGLYMDVAGGVANDGATLEVYTPNSTKAQGIALKGAQLVSDGWYTLECAAGGMLDLDGNSSAAGANIQTWTASGASNQRFEVDHPEGGPKIRIRTRWGMPLDVENGAASDGTNVRQWEDNGSDAQRWVAAIADGGYVTLKNVATGLMLDQWGGTGQAGANVEVYSANGSKAQRWRLAVTDKPADWWQKGGGSEHVHDATATAMLAIRVASRYSPEEPYYMDDAFTTTDDERSQEYCKLTDATTHWWSPNDEGFVYASCTQSVAHVVRATVDPDIYMGSPEHMHGYCESSDRWQLMGWVGSAADMRATCMPGDVLCSDNDCHTILYVGNELVREAHPDCASLVFEAADGTGFYPYLSEEGRGWGNYGVFERYSYYVYRFVGAEGGYSYPCGNVWDWLNAL